MSAFTRLYRLHTWMFLPPSDLCRALFISRSFSASSEAVSELQRPGFTQQTAGRLPVLHMTLHMHSHTYAGRRGCVDMQC